MQDFSDMLYVMFYRYKNSCSYAIVAGDTHCNLTHFNTELDVFYVSLHTFSSQLESVIFTLYIGHK